jgi:uncharacterized protein
MLRQAFIDRLKNAIKARDACAVSTVRLILAGLKERDIAAQRRQRRWITNAEIARMPRMMIWQRHEAIALYEQGSLSIWLSGSATRSL